MHSRAVPDSQVILRILWLGAVAMVIVGSLLPDSSPPLQALNALQVNDKLEHFLVYAVLAFLPTLHEKRQTFIVMALAMIVMGVGLEFGQRLVEGRAFEIGDMVADACGVLCGIALGLPARGWIRPAGTVVPSER